MKLRGKKGEFYFHTVRPNKKLKRDGREVKTGEKLYFKYPDGKEAVNGSIPVPCGAGMHGCSTFRGVQWWGDFADGYYLCVVKLGGKVRHSSNKQKSVATWREVVGMREMSLRDSSYLRFQQGLRSEDVARWVLNPKLSLPKPRP